MSNARDAQQARVKEYKMLFRAGLNLLIAGGFIQRMVATDVSIWDIGQKRRS